MPKVLAYKKGAIIYFEGDRDDRIFILQQGHIILTTMDDETQSQRSSVLNPGEFFGIKSALVRCPREETVTAGDNATCVVLSVPEFENLFSTNKQLMMKMLRVFSKELRDVHGRTMSLLNQGNVMDAGKGLYSMTKAFYDEEKWRGCIGSANRLLKIDKRYSESKDFVLMYKTALANVRQIEKREAAEERAKYEEGLDSDDWDTNDYQSEGTGKAFNLPAFDRFVKTYNNGEIIIAEFEKGESFYLIQRGLVQLTKLVHDSNKNLDILKPGEMFGEMAILDNSPRSATCIAKGKVDCLEFTKQNFEVLITGNPPIALMLLKTFCKRILDQKRRYKTLVIDDNSARIADVFCMFNEMNSLPAIPTPQAVENIIKKLNPDKYRIFPVTIQDMASWAGLTVDETRDELKKFSTSGRVGVYDSYIIVMNIDEMRRTVEQRTKMLNRKKEIERNKAAIRFD